VAARWVVRVAGSVWWRGESAGTVTVSSPTMEKSAALACSRQLASVDSVRSTWIVAFAEVAEVISKPSNRDVTGGFDWTNAAHSNQVSPAAAMTATTPMINGRRDRRLRPYRASRSVVGLVGDDSVNGGPGGRSWGWAGLGGPLCLVSGDLRLLHVHAHPDDESSKGAASTARYVAEGVEVLVATCTGGERGSILNPKMDRPEVLENITEIRRREMDTAREILGIRQEWLGWVDSGFPEGDPLPPLPEGCFAALKVEDAAAPLVKLIREFRPQVVTTYDENGGYPHPDHVMCHQITVAAFEAAGDKDAYPELGEPWQPLKLYYHHTFHYERMKALHDGMLARGLESPYADRLKDWKPDPENERRITTRVECAQYFGTRDKALLAHATQIDPDGAWFAVPLEVHQEAWPTEDYELARSLVESEQPEDDLFAGLR
jgi:mycothiol S-conjugate amidase